MAAVVNIHAVIKAFQWNNKYFLATPAVSLNLHGKIRESSLKNSQGNLHNIASSPIQVLWTFPEQLSFPKYYERNCSVHEGERWGREQEGVVTGGWGREGEKEEGGEERKKKIEMKTIKSHSYLTFLVLKLFFCVSHSANGFYKL